ncbi:MAG: DNA polymerase I [Clostridia bacterium]|nr:DNA polymerase I [Clostridia bacterium]
MTKILLLDSNSLINRAFYALPPLENKKGVVTNAIFGYLSMLARLIVDHEPTHVCAVFDLKAPTFRHLRYDQYKATRKPMPHELASQLPILKELLKELGVKICEKEGFEADDIIGTIAKRYDRDTIIVSGDRDVLQLVDENTTVFNTKRGVTDIKVYTPESMAEEDFTADKVIEYKALAGDTSDNIPGCPGVGEKTALNLLRDYGNLDGVYQNVDSIKGKLGERLRDNKELVYLSKELATINTKVPLDVTLDELEFNKDAIGDEFFAHLNELECFKLIHRFDFKKRFEGKDVTKVLSQATKVKPLGDESLPFDTLPKTVEVKEVSDVTELNKLLNGASNVIAVDFGQDITFTFDGQTEYKVVCQQTLLDLGLNYDQAVDCFREILQSSIKKVMFDVKDKMHALSAYGIEIAPPYDDVLLKSYLSNSNYTYKSVSELMAANGYTEVACALYSLNSKLSLELKEKDLQKLYDDIELPLIKVLFDTETNGFSVDIDVLDKLSIKYTEEIRSLTEEIYALTGESFNINSVQQLGEILFEKLGLPHGKKTKTGYSVAAEILEEIDHPVVTLILRYRQLKKLQSTYIDGMRGLINRTTGKVHTIFKQCLTTTGRLSSTEPNLQNIPIRTEEGREIRRMFVPSKGNVLVSADYSQIELRLLAHFSEDEVLLNAYRNGDDIHALTAAKIHDVPLDEVTKSMRRSAKAVNFGIIYGISAFGLAKNIGIRPYEAKVFVEKYFETYPSVKAYMDSNVKEADDKGYIRTIGGRVRYFPEFRSSNKNIREFGKRAAMNMPLQGSAADIMKIAMIKVYNALKEGGYKAQIILQVHDELVIDCPASEVKEVKQLLVNCMEGAVSLNVPLIADAKEGNDWYSVE